MTMYKNPKTWSFPKFNHSMATTSIWTSFLLKATKSVKTVFTNFLQTLHLTLRFLLIKFFQT